MLLKVRSQQRQRENAAMGSVQMALPFSSAGELRIPRSSERVAVRALNHHAGEPIETRASVCYEMLMKIACTVRLSEHQRQTIEQMISGVELFYPQIKYETGSPYFPTIVDPEMRDCEVLLGHINPKGLGEIAPRLRWIHLFSAGVDHVLRSDLVVKRGIVLTNSSGTTAPWIAEYVIGAMLQHCRGFNLSMHAQMEHQWSHQEVRATCHSLRGKTLGIIGYG